MPRPNSITLRIWTEHFLGTAEKCKELLRLLETMDGSNWLPDRWNECEPIRLAYAPEAHSLICSKWTREIGGDVTNQVAFRRTKPFAEIWAECWRAKVPRLNWISLSLEARVFATDQGADRITKIALRLIEWSKGVYATGRHTAQYHSRVAQMTPLKRLERMDWLTFFGRPYLEIFGGEQRVLSAPCFSAQQVSTGVLLLAAPRPDSREMTESDQTLLALEQYLGADVFASENYPEVPCRVPKFDLSETINGLKTDFGKDDGPRPSEPVIVADLATGTPSAVVVFSKS